MANSDNDNNKLFAARLLKDVEPLRPRAPRFSEPAETSDKELSAKENERRAALPRPTDEDVAEAQKAYANHVATYGESKKGDPSKGGGRY